MIFFNSITNTTQTIAMFGIVFGGLQLILMPDQHFTLTRVIKADNAPDLAAADFDDYFSLINW